LLIVTAHAKVCHLAYDISKPYGWDRPVVPTECDVLIVCRQHNDKKWKFKDQRAKMWENIAWGEKILSLPWFQHCGGERPRRPRRSDASDMELFA